jgi:hypothetical protein
VVVPWIGHYGECQHYSYVDFTQKLMERFDKKDLELHFRELAQLR